jgi:hypothetical protein
MPGTTSMKILATTMLVLIGFLATNESAQAQQSSACKICRDQQQACMKNYAGSTCKTEYQMCMKSCGKK